MSGIDLEGGMPLRPRRRPASSRRGRGRPLAAGILLALALGLVACVSTRLQPEQLPSEPIAFMHWADKAARKRGEIFEKAAESPMPTTTDERSPEAELAEMRAHLRGERSTALQQQLARHPGHLMLYWPRRGEMEQVAAAPPDALPLAWSRDHRRLLFASAHRGGEQQLYEYHLERRDLSPVTFGPAEHRRGDYLEYGLEHGLEHGLGDGRLVIHRMERRSRGAATRLSLVLAGLGGRIERILAQDVMPGALHVSLEQNRIVYEKVEPHPRRNGPTTYDSYVATRPLDRGGPEELLLRGREPTLTPDGRWIVFASESSAGYRLRRMRIDGTSRVPIEPGSSEERMPTVSPDGEFIAFIQVSGGRRQLAVRRFDGARERVLLREGWSEFPVW